MLQKRGYSSLNLRLNQDIMENRSDQEIMATEIITQPRINFVYDTSFMTLVMTNLTSKHSISSNCIENNDRISLSFLKIISAV